MGHLSPFYVSLMLLLMSLLINHGFQAGQSEEQKTKVNELLGELGWKGGKIETKVLRVLI